MLEGRPGLSVLWDIWVAPEARGKGIGSLPDEIQLLWYKDLRTANSRRARMAQ